LAPPHWTRRELLVRRPFSAAAELPILPAVALLVCTAIGTTSFDGFSIHSQRTGIAQMLQDALEGLGLSIRTALRWAFTIGLVAVVLVVYGFYRLGIAGLRTVTHEGSSGELAGTFAHSLIPIALAYVIAHYFGLLAYQGRALYYLASDRLGDGSDLFGTANAAIGYTWVSATAVWYVPVVTLVVGHAIALALAHDRALALFGATMTAVRSQYWMLAVMVGFTCLALWLLSEQS